METAEIARRWLAFFEEKGHAVVPSAPLPFDDPNLLFVVAGMVPFVPYFSGQQTPPWPRAASVQKCVRTPDLDEVGKTSRHGTFFQMNGNFSFGDYFKHDAIAYAWELLTGPVEGGRYGLDPEKLWATVYEDDDEAEALWLELTDIPKERIVRRDRLDNYWHMGIPGPGGPCSEIFYDRGPQYGPRAARRSTRTASWRSGTSSSPSSSSARSGARPTSTSSDRCRRRTSTPAWAWSGSPASSRASTTSTRSTRSGRCSTGRPR